MELSVKSTRRAKRSIRYWRALDDESSNAKHNVGYRVWRSLPNITSGTGNVAVGDSSLYTLDNGYNNVAIGGVALYNNLSDDNIAVGTGSLAMSNNASGTAKYCSWNQFFI